MLCLSASVPASYIRAVPSSHAVTRSPPLGLRTTAVTGPGWTIERRRDREATSYSRAVPSSHAVARTSPSALNAIALTEPLCSNRLSDSPDAASYRRAVPSSHAVAMMLPSGLNLTILDRVLVRETASFNAMIRAEHRNHPVVMAAGYPLAIRAE